MSERSKENIRELVINELIRVKPESNELVTDNADLHDELGLESLDIVELVARIEEKFQIMIEDAEVKQLNTINNIVNFIYSKHAIS